MKIWKALVHDGRYSEVPVIDFRVIMIVYNLQG